MIDIITTRRGFLKGIMAAAALSAVAPQVLEAIAATPAPIEPVDVPPLASELWVRLPKRGLMNRPWQFVGSITSWRFQNDAIETTGPLDDWRTFMPNPQSSGSIELINDVQGEAVLRDALFDPRSPDLMMGLGKGWITIPQAVIRGQSAQVDFAVGMCRSTIDIEFTRTARLQLP